MFQKFKRLGLPPESLEFLTLGESFSPPSPLAMVRNLPGLGRLLQRERRLEQDFRRDRQQYFEAELHRLSQKSLAELSPSDIKHHIDALLTVLTRATYYNILAPVSESIRQSLLPVEEEDLDFSQTPEVAALRSLQSLALDTRQTFESTGNRDDLEAAIKADGTEGLFQFLSEHAQGEPILKQLHDTVEEYGYLSETATDIAVST